MRIAATKSSIQKKKKEKNWRWCDSQALVAALEPRKQASADWQWRRSTTAQPMVTGPDAARAGHPAGRCPSSGQEQQGCSRSRCPHHCSWDAGRAATFPGVAAPSEVPDSWWCKRSLSVPLGSNKCEPLILALPRVFFWSSGLNLEPRRSQALAACPTMVHLTTSSKNRQKTE
jgi:hypothetical protein